MLMFLIVNPAVSSQKLLCHSLNSDSVKISGHKIWANYFPECSTSGLCLCSHTEDSVSQLINVHINIQQSWASCQIMMMGMMEYILSYSKSTNN